MDHAVGSNPLPTPLYVSGKESGDINAIFSDGSIVAVTRDRRRAYPSLASEAPPTTAFYSTLKLACPAAQRVLDVGCGSGTGTCVLVSDFPSVVGIDCDERALAFARGYVPGAELVLSDLSSPPPLAAADAAVVCDVLGQVDDPATLLRSLRAVLEAGAIVVIAEPRAYPAQHLQAPLRQAFSERSLNGLLAQSGFAVQAWLSKESSFLACVVIATGDSVWPLFGEAARAERSGNRARARSIYQQLVDTAPPAAAAEASILLAHLCLADRDGERAVSSLLRAAELSPHDARVYAGLSQIALLTGSAGDALRLAVTASEADPTSAVALRRLAESSAALGEHADSFAAWRIAAALAPADREVATELARSAAEREDFHYGIAVLERLRAHHEAMSADFHVTLGWLLTLAGRRADALLEARHALLIAPHDDRAKDLLHHAQAA